MGCCLSQSKPALPAKAPLSAFFPHYPRDVLADAPVEHVLPRHQAESIPLSIMAKRPLARLMEPTSFPVTYSPAWTGRNVRPRAPAMSRPSRSTSRRFNVATKLRGTRNVPSGLRPQNLATFLATLRGTERKIVLQGACKVAFLDRHPERMRTNF
jgi:hypothetical protein